MFAFSLRNSIVSFPPFLDLFFFGSDEPSPSPFRFIVSPSFSHAFFQTSYPIALSSSVFFLLFSNNISCSSAASHFSLISSRAWSSSVCSTSTPLSLRSFCILARYLSSKSLRCSLTDFFVTRNLNVACEFRLSAIVCHTFPLSTVLAFRRKGSNNKTSRARARSWLFFLICPFHYHTKGRKSRISIKPLAPFFRWYSKHELKKMMSIKSTLCVFFFFFLQIMQNHFLERF